MTQIWNVAIASFIGTAIEWYDFLMYGTAAALVFNRLFFPQFEPALGTLAGGEWGGAVLMAFEHAPSTRRGFFASWPQMGAPAGLLLGNFVFLAFSSLADSVFIAWAGGCHSYLA